MHLAGFGFDQECDPIGILHATGAIRGWSIMHFTKGSIVCLKSGGPRMIIEEIDGDKVTCIWFSKDTKLQRAEFWSYTLEDPGVLDELLKEVRERRHAP